MGKNYSSKPTMVLTDFHHTFNGRTKIVHPNKIGLCGNKLSRMNCSPAHILSIWGCLWAHGTRIQLNTITNGAIISILVSMHSKNAVSMDVGVLMQDLLAGKVLLEPKMHNSKSSLWSSSIHDNRQWFLLFHYLHNCMAPYQDSTPNGTLNFGSIWFSHNHVTQAQL